MSAQRVQATVAGVGKTDSNKSETVITLKFPPAANPDGIPAGTYTVHIADAAPIAPAAVAFFQAAFADGRHIPVEIIPAQVGIDMGEAGALLVPAFGHPPKVVYDPPVVTHTSAEQMRRRLRGGRA
ncbi:MAG TPA: hypothetical protein VMH39_13675 [Gemmatimonadaceae bacterium]|nr:hypothetical protein [Gemmatimonadaceae bacterium]